MRNLEMTNGGIVFTGSFDNGQSGNISISARESVNISGSDPAQSGLYTNALGSGDAGDISVTTDLLTISDGGLIFATARENGLGGDITIDAEHMEIREQGMILSSSKKQSGNISLTARDSLAITGQSGLFAQGEEDGMGGNITISSGFLTLADNSRISTSANGKSRSGDVALDLYDMKLTDGGLVITSNYGEGRSGDISINAPGEFVIADNHKKSRTSNISVIPGTGANGLGDIEALIQILYSDVINKINDTFYNRQKKDGPSSGTLCTDAYEDGDAGDISVKAGILTLADNGLITSEAHNDGCAGNVLLDVNRLSIGAWGNVNTGKNKSDFGGDISVTARDSVTISGNGGFYANTRGTGDAGDITVSADDLAIADNGIISSNTSGDGRGGDVVLDVNRLDVNTGGTVENITSGKGRGGDISVTAKDSVHVHTGGTVENITSGKGRGGDISVTANDSVHVNTGGTVTATTNSNGRGGDISVTAKNAVTISEEGKVLAEAKTANSSGRTGDIKITTGILTVSDEGVVNCGTIGKGDSGDITLNADQVDINMGYVSSSSNGEGNGGNVSIIARDSVNIFGSGKNDTGGTYADGYYGVYSQAQLLGYSGGITISADELNLAKDAMINCQTYSTGRGGDITLNVNRLKVHEGGTLTTSTRGPGRSGDICITANESVNVSGSGVRLDNSWIYTATHHAGDGGDLTISTPVLTVDERGVIYANTLGDKIQNENTLKAGNAGNITLNADRLKLSGGGAVSASSICTGKGGDISIRASESVMISGSGIENSAGIEKSGIYVRTQGLADEGSITITSPNLSASEHGTISASVLGGSNTGGKITVNVTNLDLEGNACIESATSGEGEGGEIHVSASNAIHLSNNAAISARSLSSGNAGDIFVRAGDTIRMKKSAVTTEAESADGGNINMHTQGMIRMNDSRITATVGGGQGNGGNIRMNPKLAIVSDSEIIANAHKGTGGNIRIVSDGFVRSSDTRISASSDLGIDGSVEIESPDISENLTVLPGDFLDASQWAKTPCSARSGEDASSFVSAPRDGLPTPLNDWLASSLLAFATPDSLRNQETDMPGQEFSKAKEFYDKGDFIRALQLWEQTAALPDAEKQAYFYMMMYMADAYQAIGHYQQASSSLRNALSVVEKNSIPHLSALFFSSLGDLSLCAGKVAQAEEYLEKGAKEARLAGKAGILAGALNNLGNLLAADEDYQGAMAAYEESLELIEDTPDIIQELSLLKSKVMINIAHVRFMRGDDEDTLTALDDAVVQIKSLPDSHHKASDFISLGLLTRMVHKKYALSENRLRNIIYQTFNQAKQIAEVLQDTRIVSYACGYLGQLLEEQGRYSDATRLTWKALFSAQQGYYPEILYLWQWQLGRLFKIRGDIEKSVKFYTDAAHTLKSVRAQFFRGYRSKKGIFFENIKPVYLELAQLMLKQAETEDEQYRETKLKQAMNTMELMKTAELQSYFEDECMTARHKKPLGPDHIPSGTAVIYPISFPDHLALLLVLPNEIRHIRVPVDSERLRKKAEQFRERLQEFSKKNRVLYYAKQLYNWLIRPIEPELTDRGTDTLIVAPDGVLRLIPFAGLYDGHQYLIEKYALVTVPAITLTDHGHINPDKAKILLNGLSIPTREFPALSGVPGELKDIKQLMGGRILQDEDFTNVNRAF